ncbi:Serine/threonine-protein kinase 17A [Cryptotermes secundus]|uniref:Serine/threonine-protein kinase 17A n=2 Tax=Cryptotermes secundus TaxID=105785 RepID=A0A2J7QIM4_9NEOP|nr:Serine/threonine-protein kinase 17A [Cryptotermes secundus]
MILLLELASGGELQMLLDKDEVPEERQVKRLMHQILDGLVYLHSINVAHLDIKPQNLVLMSEFPHGEVKLCDLGISRYISEGADIRDILGTPDYVAPEVLNYESISLATDMWSVGVLLYVLLTGCSPFGGDTKQETFCNISQCKLDFPEDLFEDVSEDAKDLMRKLMVKEPRERLSAIECLQHHWFTDTEKMTVQPVQTPVRCSEIITAKMEEVRIVKLSSPTTSRKQDDITSQILSSHGMTVTCKTSPTNVTSVHRPRESSVPITKSSDICSVTSQGGKTPEKAGMSFSRRSRFIKNMENLAQSYSDLTSTENHNIIDSKCTLEKMDSALYSTSGQGKGSTVNESANIACKVENNTSTYINVRSVNKATAMQTMPVSGISRYRLSHPLTDTETVAKQRQQNQNIPPKTEDEVPRRIMDNKDCVYTFRRCFIIDDSEDETAVGNSTAPILIHGSVPTSDNTHSYSDHSSSDSGSDTVSEMSIDSSSDRSSIISLDDSLLEYNYSKINGRPYPAGNYVSYSSANNNVWYSAGTLNAPRNERAARYSCSETFSKAFARFNSVSGDTQETAMNKTEERSIFARAPRKQYAKAAHTSVLNKVLVSSISNDNTSAVRKVDFLREHNGNIVVIREVKAGKYNRVSEVKCESVQSRIRKLQVQGAKP